MKKKLCKISRDKICLSKTVDANIRNVNFLDINNDLQTGIFIIQNIHTYIHIHNLRNHPPVIIKNIPHSETED